MYNIWMSCRYSPSLTPAAKSEIIVSSKKTRAVSPMISSSADDITFEGQQKDPHSTYSTSIAEEYTFCVCRTMKCK